MPAWEIPVLDLPLVAGADLSSAQHTFVRLNANNQVIQCSATTDQPIGILQNNPANGQAAAVRVDGVSKLVSGAALTAGWIVGPNASGQGTRVVPGTDTTRYMAAMVIEGTGAASEKATVMLG